MSESQAGDPFESSDDSEKDKDYEPVTIENGSLPDIELHSQMSSMQIEDEILEDIDDDDGSGEIRTTSEERKWQGENEDPPDTPFLANVGININMENDTMPLVNIVVQETHRRDPQKTQHHVQGSKSRN
ncbi:hypothetical protein JTB14_015565 [Gonioctena quinquepunctata]|nr:hypothetical protein JTB14_015565 [Gonioctena quinquepunctata]